MLYKTSILFLFLLMCLVPLSAQQITFSKAISEFPLNAENGAGVFQMNNGDYIMVSINDCSGFGSEHCCVISRLDQQGNILWFKEYNFYPRAGNTVVFNGNKIYVSGHTNDTPSKFSLYCLDLDGNILWNRAYGSAPHEVTFPELLLGSGGYLWLCGSRKKLDSAKQDEYVVKVTLDGDFVADYLYGLQNDGSYHGSVSQTDDGQILLSYTDCPMACFNLWTGTALSIDTDGNVLWGQHLLTSWFPARPFTVQTDDTTLVTSWYSNYTQFGYDDTPNTFFYRNLQGDVLDSLVIVSKPEKLLTHMEAIRNKGLIACGQTNIKDNAGVSSNRGWVIRVNNDKTVAWDRNYTDTSFMGTPQLLWSIKPTQDGGFIAVGTIDNHMTGVGESHSWLLKLDSSGCLTPGCADTVYITTPVNEAVFLKGKDVLLYPNPASDWVRIRFPEDFDLSPGLYVILTDAQGKRIASEQVTGNEMTLDVHGLPSGTGYVMLRRGNEILLSKRVVKVTN